MELPNNPKPDEFLLPISFVLSELYIVFLINMSSLWQKYNAIAPAGRLWIGVSTMIVAYGGMQLSDYLYEKDLEKQLVNDMPNAHSSSPASSGAVRENR